MSRVKGETTAEYIKDNEKFGPETRYHNACRNVLCTNHPNALDVDQEQRHVAVFQYVGLISSDDHQFNHRMSRMMDDEHKLLAFVRYLKDHGTTYSLYGWRGNRLNPEVMRNMMRTNDPLIVKFLADHTANNNNEREIITFSTWKSMVHTWTEQQPGNVVERARQ